MMATLYVDLGSAHPCFALVQDDRCIALQTIADHKDEAGLMPALEALLHEHTLDWKSIDRIALMAGPGGFMSLRVGAAFVNALSYGLGIPSASVHGSDVWAARARGIDHFLWLHSTKKAQLFIRGFGSFTATWPETALIDLDALTLSYPIRSGGSKTSAPTGDRDLPLKAPTPTLSRAPERELDRIEDMEIIPFVGELIPEHQSALSVRMIDELQPLEKVLPGVLAKLTYKADQTLLPWYGREG